MSKHTPGPWRVAPPSVGRFKVCTVEGGKIVGEASNYNEQADANARLIAAAPELLVAAQDAFSILCHLDEPIPYERIAECIEDLRAAIAKATGEQS